MKLRLLYHGHCFDGVASAATFTRFYKQRIHPEAEVGYTGLLHRPGNLFDQNLLDSDENAIVDFKYAATEKLPFPVLLDPESKTADAYSVEGIPTMFVIGKDGKVEYAHTGLQEGMQFVLMRRLGISYRGTEPVADRKAGDARE